jgi:cell division GTPase FtsZ
MIQESLNVIGLGQAGSRIAKFFDRANVPTMYANSDEVDFRGLNIPENKTLLIEGTGTGCSYVKGLQIVDKNLDTFISYISKVLNKDKLNLFIFGCGGGSGSSMSTRAIKYAIENKYRVGVLTVLPADVLGIVPKGNAIKTLEDLKEFPINTFILADNEYLSKDIVLGKDWWSEINQKIYDQVEAAFEITGSKKTSQAGIGSIDKGELMRILQYGNGLIDIRTFRIKKYQMTEEYVEELLHKPVLTEGYNYKDSLAYIINIDTPTFGNYSQFAQTVFMKSSGKYGSAISKFGMFIDGSLSEEIVLTIITAGLKFPKIVTKEMKKFNREGVRLNKKKDKEDKTDFSIVDSSMIDDEFDI